MKTFWFGCAGVVGVGVSILAVVMPQPAGVSPEGPSQASLRDRPQRSHERARAPAFEEIPTGAERELALRELSGRWAMKDPAAAERWAESLGIGTEREAALNKLAVAWGKENPKAAIELAQRHHLSQGILDTIWGQWGKADLEAAMEGASSLPAGTAQEGALLQIITAHAGADPATAALLVTQRLPPGPGQEEAVMTVLHHWLKTDEAAAADWVKQFPQDPLRIRAEAEIGNFRFYRSAASITGDEPGVSR